MTVTTLFADDDLAAPVDVLQDELRAAEAARLQHAEIEIASALHVTRETGLAESVAYLLVLSVLQRVIGLGRGLLVCLWMTPALLGPWDLANRFFFLAAPLVVLGLPGTFGRYLEHYRTRGALRDVLKRILIAAFACAGVGFVVLQCFPAAFADLFFGTPEETEILRLSAVCLLAVVAYNTLTELLNALRLVKANAILQFANTLAFAGLCVILLAGWRADARAVIVAFGAACLLGVLGGGWYLARVWHALPTDRIRVSRGELWSKLLPFAAWVWIANLLTNSLESSSRYMMLHYSGLTDQLAIDAMIGNYHAAQLIPNLMITLAAMLGGTLLPHLARDWEAGRRARVSDTMNFALKLIALGAFAVAVVVSLCGPLLFDVLLKGKYSAGEAVLPLTLAGTSWAAIAMVAGVYLWCAEHARIGCLALAGGLLVNVTLNNEWLPEFGLAGSVTASACGALTVLCLLFALCAGYGFRADRRTLLTAVLPGTLLLGILPAGLMFVALIAILIYKPGELFSTAEQAKLRELAGKLVQKSRSRFARPTAR